MYKTQYEGYEDRLVRQELLWLNCRPIHNTIEDECCADFSCCEPWLFELDIEKRQRECRRLLFKIGRHIQPWVDPKPDKNWAVKYTRRPSCQCLQTL